MAIATIPEKNERDNKFSADVLFEKPLNRS